MNTKAGFERAGPILHFRGHHEGNLHLAAVVVRPEGIPCGVLRASTWEVQPAKLAELEGLAAWRYDFQLGAADRGYELEGTFYEVQTDPHGDLRIAFVSCNGEEHGDLDRDPAERNAMWARLVASHKKSAFTLLLQGGDQVYADEATRGHPLSEGWPEDVPKSPTQDQLEDLGAHLSRAFLQRYMSVLCAEEYAWIAARVPTLSVWDDHDICDGWGSLPRGRMSSAVGQTLFGVAREFYLLFQHGGNEADIPSLFLDPDGASLAWKRNLPGLTILAPDLRSERGRRQIIGEAGWRSLSSVHPERGHTVLLSSVPLLGPRLSVLERIMTIVPKMQRYEDDLRDQWQSRTHREEWRRALREVLRLREVGSVTVLSGEIHLATRAEMGSGASCVHQLVASGIAHPPPPKAFARFLGWLATLGEAPLPEHPIRILPLPGQKQRYVAQRNFLVLERRAGAWTAFWQLEESGPTPSLLVAQPPAQADRV